MDTPLEPTPLDARHRALGAKMVPFAGYSMPVQYESIIAEHKHTRESASVFDVSHMGQAALVGESAADVLESLSPGSFKDLEIGRQRYALLTNAAGGVIDDFMALRVRDGFLLVVNASRKQADFEHIAAHVSGDCEFTPIADRGLLALQGPRSAEALSPLAPEAAAMTFMDGREMTVGGAPCVVTRSGYTGEDGFEISVPADMADALMGELLDRPGVLPAGLGARDSLRLEAGLCLYGNDIDETTSPVEAALAWTIGKRRRAEGGFPGADRILGELENGAPRRRVGIRPQGRAIARAHARVVAGGEDAGEVTSGGFGPSVDGPVAMGYLRRDLAKAGTPVELMVRDKPVPAEIAKLPFAPHRYAKG